MAVGTTDSSTTFYKEEEGSGSQTHYPAIGVSNPCWVTAERTPVPGFSANEAPVSNTELLRTYETNPQPLGLDGFKGQSRSRRPYLLPEGGAIV